VCVSVYMRTRIGETECMTTVAIHTVVMA